MRGLLKRLRFRSDHRWTPPHASPYLDGELPRAQRARVERHIADCPECRALLRELGALVVALGTLRGGSGVPVAESVVSSVRNRIEAAGQDAT